MLLAARRCSCPLIKGEMQLRPQCPSETIFQKIAKKTKSWRTERIDAQIPSSRCWSFALAKSFALGKFDHDLHGLHPAQTRTPGGLGPLSLSARAAPRTARSEARARERSHGFLFAWGRFFSGLWGGY